MVIRAEVGDQPDVSFLVGDLGRVSSSSGSWLVRDIVDAVVLIDLAIGVHHGHFVSLMGETILLQMVFLFAVSADDVEVPDRGGGGGGASLVAGLAIVLEVGEGHVVVANDSDLVELLVRQVVPDDLPGFLILKFGLDGSDAGEPLVVILMFSRLRATLTLSVKVSLAASRTLSWMPSFRPARKSWCLMYLKASALASWTVEAVALMAAMVAGFLSVRRL
jgi:hypothetical protein